MALDHLTKITSQSGIKTTLDYAMSDLTVDTITVRSGGGGLGGNVNAGIVTISSLTAGTIPYVGTGNTLTESDNLTWDNTNVRLKNLGITSTKDLNVTGIVTASSDIHVGENIKHIGDTDTKIVFTDNQIDFHANSASRLYVNQYAAYLQTTFPFAFLASTGASPSIKSGGQNNQSLLLTSGTDNPTRLAVKPDGKIGIGLTNPNAMMQIISDQNAETDRFNSSNYHLMLQNTGNDTGEAVGMGFSISDDIDKVGAAILHERSGGGSAGSLQFYTNSDGASVTERLRITADGKVGINEDVPQSTLHVASTSNYVDIGLSNSTSGHTGSDGANIFYNNSLELALWNRESTGIIRFATAGTEKLRITSGGDVLIGRQSTSTSHTLCVQSDGNAETIAVIGRSSDDISEIGFFENDTTTRLGEIQYRQDHTNIRHRVGDIRFCTGGAAEKVRIASDGRVQISGQNAIATTSLTHRLLVRSQNDSNAIAIAGRNGDHIGELSFYQSDASTKIGDIEGHSDHLTIASRAGYIQLATGGTSEKVRIDSSGRLRIGNTTQNQYTAADDLIIGTGSGDRGLTIYSGGSDAGIIAFSDGTSDTAYRSGQIIYDHSTNAMDFRTNANYIRLTIANNGKLYIGSDTTDFSDAGTFLNLRNNTYGGRIGFSNNTTTAGVTLMEQFAYWGTNKVAGIIAKAGTDTNLKNSGYLAFYTRPSGSGSNNQERLRITSEGNVGIGEDDPQTKLNVKGSVSTGRNLAREVGTIINISSSYSGTRNGVSVISGQKNYEENTNGDWITANGQRANANLTIDLGAQYTCDRFVIYNQNEYANNVREVKRFTLEGSNDNSSWTTILDDEAGASYAHEPNPGWSFHMPANNFDDVEGVTYRYWKFTMKTYHGSTTLGGVMELELYEASDTTTSEITTHSVVATDIYAKTIHHEAPAFFACRTSSFSIPNQSTTLIQFVDNQGPGFDTNNCWDNSNYRFTPNVPGYYSINMVCSVSYGSLQAGRIFIYKNGTSYAMSQLYLNGGESYDDISMSCSTLVFLNGTGDYIDGRAWRNGGNGGLGDNATNQQISGFLARSAGPREHGNGVA